MSKNTSLDVAALKSEVIDELPQACSASRDRGKQPGPKPERLKIDVPWEEAAAKMIRTPPMPKGEKGDDGAKSQRRRRGGAR